LYQSIRTVMGKINKELTILLILTLSVTMLTLAEVAETSHAQANANQAASSGDYWTTEASLPIARRNLGATAVDGKIYAIGGRNADTIFGLNQQYDPVTNQWIDKAAMPTPRYDFAMAVYGGKIYCIGGVADLNYHWGDLNYSLSNANEVYDPATDTWHTEASMPQGSDGQASVVNGIIYVISGNSNPNLQIIQAYDPATNQWSTKTSMPDRNGYCAASAVIGNKIYAIGGYTSRLQQNVVQIYDTISDSWTAGTPPAVNMGGYVAGAVTVGGSNSPMIELFGLTGNANPITNGSTANQIYDPATDSWAILSSMPTSRENFGIALLNNDIYIMGGSIHYYPYAPDDVGGSLRYFSTNERYTVPPVITMPTPTITQAPSTNTTQPPPTQSEPNSNTITSELVLGAVVATLIVTVSVIFVIARRGKSSQK
jgi:N-acetylneuraminic acid mutarotase